MLLVVRDENNQIKGAIEILVVDRLGQLDPKGQYAWIEQFELSKGANIKEVLAEIVYQASLVLHDVMYVYWRRKEKTLDKIHIYPRHRILALARR